MTHRRNVARAMLALLMLCALGQSSAATPQTPRVRVGGDVQAPVLIHHVAPRYPENAKKREGTVVIEIVISTEGAVLDTKMVTAVDPSLDTAAVDAVKLWKYVPTVVKGRPVEVVMPVKVTFIDPKKSAKFAS